MPNQPPLNPDGVRAAEELMIRTDRITKINYLDAERIISAYLAAALPEVTSVEELEKLPIMTVAMFTIPPLERRMPFELCTINREDKIWMQPGDGAGYRNYMMARYLPATVIHLPEVNP